MPHDVTMPQLGMAQDSGKIVSWLKQPGDQVAKGDALFEVETDKATMEVEAQADGFLTGVVADAGDDVPVGQVIARITDSAAENTEPPAENSNAPTTDPQALSDEAALPDGKQVTMPQLGMAQDKGLLVNWQKAPGDAVAADDVLFEVETDKSTMEVPAGADGYLAATLAEAGEEVPVGLAVAVISAEKPQNPIARSFASAQSAPQATAEVAPKPQPTSDKPPAKPAPGKQPPKPVPLHAPGERILASPKARRLASERGLNLSRLAEAGYPQPYHVADLETLAALPQAANTAAASTALRLTAEAEGNALTEFAIWAAETQGIDDPAAILAGFAGASLSPAGPSVIAVEQFGTSRSYAVTEDRSLSAVDATEEPPALLLRDLRGSRLTHISLGAEELPILSITGRNGGLTVTLECSPAQLSPDQAIALVTEFAGRLEEPLRHLL